MKYFVDNHVKEYILVKNRTFFCVHNSKSDQIKNLNSTIYKIKSMFEVCQEFVFRIEEERDIQRTISKMLKITFKKIKSCIATIEDTE